MQTLRLKHGKERRPDLDVTSQPLILHRLSLKTNRAVCQGSAAPPVMTTLGLIFLFFTMTDVRCILLLQRRCNWATRWGQQNCSCSSCHSESTRSSDNDRNSDSFCCSFVQSWYLQSGNDLSANAGCHNSDWSRQEFTHISLRLFALACVCLHV